MLQVGTRVKVNKNCELAKFIGMEGVVVDINDIHDYCNFVQLDTGRKTWFSNRELEETEEQERKGAFNG